MYRPRRHAREESDVDFMGRSAVHFDGNGTSHIDAARAKWGADIHSVRWQDSHNLLHGFLPHLLAVHATIRNFFNLLQAADNPVFRPQLG